MKVIFEGSGKELAGLILELYSRKLNGDGRENVDDNGMGEVRCVSAYDSIKNVNHLWESVFCPNLNEDELGIAHGETKKPNSK